MPDIINALLAAWQLVLSGDPTLVAIVSLSLSISLTAVLFATAFGLPLGAALAVLRFPGRNAAVVVVNALMGLPPVVAGLFVYLLLSRSGPLGGFGLLFTPTATTRTRMPVASVKAGSRWPNSPDSSVEVVEATVMNGCSAAIAEGGASRKRHARASGDPTQRLISPPRCARCCE